MKWFNASLFLFALYRFDAVLGESGNDAMSDISRLRKKLFDPDVYDREIRPVKHENTSVDVYVNALLENILRLDLTSNVLTMNLFFCYYWIDEFLTWDPRDYNDLEDISVETSEIWIPDVVALNMAYTEEFRSDPRASLSHAGFVWWCPQHYLFAYCTMNMQHFPNDKHTCTIYLTSPTWFERHLKLIPVIKEWNVLEHNVSLSEFKLTDVQFGIRNRSGASYELLELNVTLTRQSSNVRVMVSLPTAMVSILTLVVFLVPVQNDKRISLACFNVFLCVFILFQINPVVKVSSKTPYIVIYLAHLIILEGSVVIFSVALLNIATSPMPIRPHRAVIEFLSRPLVSKVGCLCVPPSGNMPPQPDDDPERRSISNGGVMLDEVKRQEWILVAQATNRVLFVIYCFILMIEHARFM